MISFKSSDTVAGSCLLRKYYHVDTVGGHSGPFSEHSTVTSWGRETEAEAHSNLITSFPGNMALRNLGAVFSRLSLTSVTARNTKWLSHSWFHSRLPPLSTAANTPLASLSLASVTCAALTSSRQCFTLHPNGLSSHTLFNPKQTHFLQVRGVSSSVACLASLYQMHRTGPIKKKRKNKNPLGNRPFARGVVLKTLIKKPKKPNSANRKCVLVRLTTGRDMIAYVPGEGHNLQEHNIVLVRPGRLRDTPGVKLKCVRGKYDLQHVIKKQR